MKKYEDLTFAEKDKICNGCGGKGGWIKPPYATMWDAECDHHDYGYHKGGSWRDRLVCDAKFWWNLQKDSLSWKWQIHKVIYFSGWSALYFAGVRLAGWRFFNYS